MLSPPDLAPAIAYGVREARQGEAEPAWPDRSGMSLFVNTASEWFRSLEPRTVDSRKIESLELVHETGRGGPFGPMLDVRRELALAFQSGSTVPTSILCGASAEVLLRELLMLLLWEEGRLPNQASPLVGEHSVSKLVFSQFHSRLGGSWSKEGTGPIAEWRANIANLRNRTVHVGYVPSKAEIKLAMDTYERLERFIGDRLASSVSTYPLSAMSFLGTPGMERRRVLDRFERRMAVGQHPHKTAEVFERWRREVRRCTDDGPWVGDPDGSNVGLLLYADGREQWWITDDRTELACQADKPAMSPSQEENLERLRADLHEHELTEHVSMLFEAHSAPLASEPEWIPYSEVLPLHSISRYPVCLVPPAESIG